MLQAMLNATSGKKDSLSNQLNLSLYVPILIQGRRRPRGLRLDESGPSARTMNPPRTADLPQVKSLTV